METVDLKIPLKRLGSGRRHYPLLWPGRKRHRASAPLREVSGSGWGGRPKSGLAQGADTTHSYGPVENATAPSAGGILAGGGEWGFL
ncbi:MAG: hypothetical protein ACOX52_05420 [Verrucomicrobiota bacterium]